MGTYSIRLIAAVASGVLLAMLDIAAVAQEDEQDVDRQVNPAAVATTQTDAEQALRAIGNATAESLSTPETVAAPIIPKVWCGAIDDLETKAVCWKAYRASLAYYETGLSHRSGVFQWQHISTIVIFFTVLGLVFAGVFFAWLQFRRDAVATTQSLELSATGVKLSSNFLGVVILALSLGFFYLYLVYVYPIHELF